MTTLPRWMAAAATVVVMASAVPAARAAQAGDPAAPNPNAPAQRGAPLRGAGAGGGLTSEEIYTLLDAFVMTRAQAALQLNDSQFASFFQPMTRLQALQRQHRRQRQRVLNELRRLLGPTPPQGADEASIAAKTKELDDLEAQISGDERKALGEIDQVLQVPQRARLRVFLENMERQKLDLLVKARQGRGGAPNGPPPGPVR